MLEDIMILLSFGFLLFLALYVILIGMTSGFPFFSTETNYKIYKFLKRFM